MARSKNTIHRVKGYRIKVMHDNEVLFDLRHVSSDIPLLTNIAEKYIRFDEFAFIEIEPVTWEVKVYG